MILVVGATGLVGGKIALRLLADGKQVRVLARHNSPSGELAKMGLATSLDTLRLAGAQVVYGDMKDPPSLEAACQGIETLITTANSVLRGGEDNIESIDLKGNLSLIAAAKQAGVSHFIFTSVFPPATPESPNPVVAAKGTAEQALRQSGMDFTILAANAFMDIWAMTVVGMPVLKGQPVTLIEPGSHRHSLIAMEDVAGYAVAAVDNPAARNAYLSIGGPQALSWKDIVATFERSMGCTAKLYMVKPGETVPGQPDWVTQMMPMFEAYEGIQDTSELSKVYGVPGTSLEEFIQRTLAPGRA